MQLHQLTNRCFRVTKFERATLASPEIARRCKSGMEPLIPPSPSRSSSRASRSGPMSSTTHPRPSATCQWSRKASLMDTRTPPTVPSSRQSWPRTSAIPCQCSRLPTSRLWDCKGIQVWIRADVSFLICIPMYTYENVFLSFMTLSQFDDADNTSQPALRDLAMT